MLKVVVVNKPESGNSALASALNQWLEMECHTLNIPSDILYESSKLIQPDIFILNNGYEGYEGILLVKKIRANNPEAIVIMVSSNGETIIHPEVSKISQQKLPQVKNINRLMTIHRRIQKQTKPGLKFYERKWCFYRMSLTDVLFLLMNLVSNSSLPKANQRILATAI